MTAISRILRRWFLSTARSGVAPSLNAATLAANGRPPLRELVIPSVHAETERVHDVIQGELAAHGFDDHAAFAVRLSVEEALVNAIEHGNGGDPAKCVRVAYCIGPDEASVEIEDQGRGFRLEHVPDCFAEERRHEPHGRGLLLMRKFMSSVEFNERGNCVRLRKRRVEFRAG